MNDEKPAEAKCRHFRENPGELHLGDGVHAHNYYFIHDALRREPGSKKKTAEIEKRQAEAQNTSGQNALKPPSANVVESEFSHLLGVVARSNDGIGAAVFDRHGLKIGAAGAQLDSMVLPPETIAEVAEIGDGPAKKVLHTCDALEEHAKSCDRDATRGIPCPIDTSKCVGTLVAQYRPVPSTGETAIAGVSVIVYEDRPICPPSQAP